MSAFIGKEIDRLNRQLVRLSRRGDYAAAVAMAARVCELVRKYIGDRRPELVEALVQLGDLYAARGDYTRAKPHYEEALDVQAELCGDRHPCLVPTLQRLMQLEAGLGNNIEAAAYRERMVDSQRAPALEKAAIDPADISFRVPDGIRSRAAGNPSTGATSLDLDVVPPAAVGRGRSGGWLRRYKTAVQWWARLFRAKPAQEEATGDWVDCCIFAPSKAASENTIFIQVFALLAGQESLAERLARRFDENTAWRNRKCLEARIALESRLTFQLTVPDLEIDEPVQSLIWRGRPESIVYAVHVPKDQAPRDIPGTVRVSVDTVPVGHIYFKLSVVGADGGDAGVAVEQQGDDAHRYRRAFISYATPDRPEVLKRVSMLRLQRIKFFQDLLDIDPGEEWEKRLFSEIDRCDLFLLFWSAAAKASPWVAKEVRRALRRRSEGAGGLPEILPVPIEGPPIVEPPDELQHIHFNDPLLYLARQER
jgi:tetratricopeptide (TPR) repeat protein